MRRFVFAAFALTVFAACQPVSTELTEEQKTEIEAEVRAFAEAYLAVFPDLDAVRLKELFADEGFSLVNNAVRFSRADWDGLIDQVSADWLSMEGAWDDTDIRVLGQNAAVFEGTYHTRRTEGDGRVVVFPEGFWTALCERRNGEWKWVMIHQSYGDPIVEEG